MITRLKRLYYYLLGYRWVTVHKDGYGITSFYKEDLQLLIKIKESEQLYNPVLLTISKGYRIVVHDHAMHNNYKTYMNKCVFLKCIIDLQKIR